MSAIGFATRRRIAPAAAPSERTGPDPTFLEGVWNTTVSSDTSAMFDMDMQDRREAILRPVIDELKRRGAARDYVAALTNSGGDWNSVTGMVLGDLAAARARDPKLFGSIPIEPEKFEAWLAPQSPYYKEYARTSVIAGRASRTQSIVGTLAAGLADPMNTVGLVLGGPATKADTFASAALREGINNAKFAAMTQPVLAVERGVEAGKTTSAGEIVTNIAVAGALGAGFGGAGKGVERVAPPITEATLKAILPVLPERLREKYAGKTTIDDADLPDIAEAVIGKGKMTQDERDAMVTLRRSIEIERSSPYEATGAGTAANRDGLREAMTRILSDGPAPSRAALNSSTSLSSPRDTGFTRSPVTGVAAVDTYIASARRAESGGSDAARASTSSAYGRYQFTKSTWKRYYVDRYGRQGLSDQQIYAKRADGATQDVLMRDLTEYNASVLRRNNVEVTPGSLYLLHFAGEGDGMRVLRASPDTPIEAVMSGRSIAANGAVFRRVRTAGELAAWADRRMGGEGRAPAGSGEGASGAGDPLAGDYADLARLQDEGAALAGGGGEPTTSGADRVAAALDGESVPDVPAIAAPDAREPEPVMFDGPQPELKPEFEPRAPNDAEVADAVRAYVGGTRESLKPAAIAERLGIDKAKATAALEAIAREADSGLTVRGAGRFAREDTGAPRDLLKFIAEHGGIAKDADAGLLTKRNLSPIAPSGGVVFRKGGRSLDEMRELAAEAGYFHDGSAPDMVEATTVDDFVQAIEDAYSTPRYALDDLVAAEDWRARRERETVFAEARGAFDQHLTNQSIELHPVERVRAAEWMAREGIDAEQATARIVNEHVQDVLDALAEQAEIAGYDVAADRFEQSLTNDAGRVGEGINRPQDIAEPASGVGARGEELRGGARPDADVGNARDLDLDRQPVDPNNYEAFSDPAGPATAAIADSLLHDMRPMVDPAEGPSLPKPRVVRAKEARTFSFETGKPVIVEAHHGTAKEFDEFNAAHLGAVTGAPSAKGGFFFTDRKKTADYYAQIAAGEENIGRLRDRVEGRVMTREITMDSPLVVDLKGRVFRDESYNDIISRAKAAGHDGVIFRRTYDAGEYGRFDATMSGRLRSETVYTAFNSEQIRVPKNEPYSVGFKLDDRDPVRLADVLREIDDEEASIKSVRDCL